MPHIAKLPHGLDNGAALIKRRERAATLKEMWRDIYQECYEYCMPQRETFSWYAPGQRKNRHLYDSTGQTATYIAANNAQALLCPSWKQWSALSPGGDIDPDEAENPEVIDGLQEATTTVFHYLNHSNFSTVIPEVFLDLMVGTGALDVDEGPPEDPLLFDAIPLSVLELEEGPNGRLETTFMRRTPLARNLVRMFQGMAEEDLPPDVQEQVKKKPDTEVPIIQAIVFNPKDRKYYGVVLIEASKKIVWRWNYEQSSPRIVGRASVISGEIYGRGRVMAALPDIKTLNTMQEFVLRHSAIQAAGVYTGVSSGIFNPYTAQIIPNTIIPVASNDRGNPSLAALETGQNFIVTSEIMQQLRESVRQTLMGQRRSSDQRVHSATEVAIDDRNRLWDMGAEFGRIQAEILAPVVSRCVFILQRQGKIPPIQVDGRQVTLKYVSPLARAQDADDLLALQQSIELSSAAAAAAGEAGMAAMALGWKLDNLPAWLAKRTGLDADLVRTDAEKKQIVAKTAAAAQAMQQQPGAAQAPAAGPPRLRSVA